MRETVHYIPIITTFVAFAFAYVIFRRYQERKGAHLAWWAAGAALYGVGTLTEATVTLFGWHEVVCWVAHRSRKVRCTYSSLAPRPIA